MGAVGTSPLERLPAELRLLYVKHLDPEDVARLTQVSKTMRGQVQDSYAEAFKASLAKLPFTSAILNKIPRKRVQSFIRTGHNLVVSQGHPISFESFLEPYLSIKHQTDAESQDELFSKMVDICRVQEPADQPSALMSLSQIVRSSKLSDQAENFCSVSDLINLQPKEQINRLKICLYEQCSFAREEGYKGPIYGLEPRCKQTYFEQIFSEPTLL